MTTWLMGLKKNGENTYLARSLVANWVGSLEFDEGYVEGFIGPTWATSKLVVGDYTSQLK